MLEIDGIVAAQRFKVAEAQMGGADATAEKYLAIYEIEADNLAEALAKSGGSADHKGERGASRISLRPTAPWAT